MTVEDLAAVASRSASLDAAAPLPWPSAETRCAALRHQRPHRRGQRRHQTRARLAAVEQTRQQQAPAPSPQELSNAQLDELLASHPEMAEEIEGYRALQEAQRLTRIRHSDHHRGRARRRQRRGFPRAPAYRRLPATRPRQRDRPLASSPYDEDDRYIEPAGRDVRSRRRGDVGQGREEQRAWPVSSCAATCSPKRLLHPGRIRCRLAELPTGPY